MVEGNLRFAVWGCSSIRSDEESQLGNLRVQMRLQALNGVRNRKTSGHELWITMFLPIVNTSSML